MPVYKDEAKGTWYCKFRYTDWTGRKRFTTKRGFRTKREAKEYEYSFKHETKKADMTINDLCREYMEQYRVRYRETSTLYVESTIKAYINNTIGSVKLSELTRHNLLAWQNKILSLDLSDSTRRNINTRMKSILNFAVHMDYMESNPMSAMRPIGKTSRRDGFWTLEQYKKFLDAGKNHPNYKFLAMCFNVLFYGGLRLGEFLGATQEAFDFEKNTISITQALNNLGKVSGLKNEQSRRVVPMPASIMREVKEYIDCLYEVPSPLFAISRKTLAYYLRLWADRAGIPQIVLHSLRHSHVSYLISLGVPITAISKRIGHKSPKVTLDVYSHMYAEDAEAIASILESRIVGQGVVNKKKDG